MRTKNVGELTAEDIKEMALIDPVIHSSLRAFDVTTQKGWESALITALYVQTKKVQLLADELLKYNTKKEDKE